MCLLGIGSRVYSAAPDSDLKYRNGSVAIGNALFGPSVFAPHAFAKRLDVTSVRRSITYCCVAEILPLYVSCLV